MDPQTLLDGLCIIRLDTKQCQFSSKM